VLNILYNVIIPDLSISFHYDHVTVTVLYDCDITLNPNPKYRNYKAVTESKYITIAIIYTSCLIDIYLMFDMTRTCVGVCFTFDLYLLHLILFSCFIS